MAKIDFAMTPDGDLSLGSPKLDIDNQILYYHTDGTESINQYKNGVEGKPTKDMSYVIGREAWKQIIMNRLRTDAPDWYHHPRMGANMTDLIGEPNSRETADIGAQYIMDALTYYGLFQITQINIRPVPINNQEIVFYVSVNIDDGEPFRLPILFNLNYGLKEV